MSFNSEKESENVIKFVKDYYKKNNLKGAIVGISGGKDSAVVTAILVKALGKENVVGVAMPCHSILEDKMDAKFVADFYGIEFIDYDLTETYDVFRKGLTNTGIDFTENELKNSDINLRPRLRMATLYYLAALYSAIKKGTYLVAGTSNKSELYVGYFTKGGDQVHDFEVISDFTVSEVIKIGEYLRVPEKILYKAPSDGLSGQTDEEKMGVTYHNIEKYIYSNQIESEVKEKIKKMHEANFHKFNMPAYKRPKVGVFVGSFDPIHKGHLHIANHLLNNNYVDKIILIPTGDYWTKHPIATLEDRIQMCKFLENENIEVSSTLGRLEYTHEILQELEKEYSQNHLFLVIGADTVVNFDKWMNLNDLLKYHIIVVNRDNIDINKYVDRFEEKDKFIIVENFDYIPISATYIRQNIDNDIVKPYLDDNIYEYIKEKKLYK